MQIKIDSYYLFSTNINAAGVVCVKSIERYNRTDRITYDCYDMKGNLVFEKGSVWKETFSDWIIREVKKRR